mmetsp:Transcript_138577/g.442001  ORF Transcript_138577/g.442001 Transcript_138577/m.442001 type:complete len:508 (+) Transcript_138577:1811-3334(+)
MAHDKNLVHDSALLLAPDGNSSQVRARPGEDQRPAAVSAALEEGIAAVEGVVDLRGLLRLSGCLLRFRFLGRLQLVRRLGLRLLLGLLLRLRRIGLGLGLGLGIRLHLLWCNQELHRDGSVKNAAWWVHQRRVESVLGLVREILQRKSARGCRTKACPQQGPSSRVVLVPQRLCQGCAAIAVFLRTLLDQQVDSRGMTELARERERCPAIRIGDVYLRLGAEEQPQRADVALLRRKHQRSGAPRAEAVHVDGSFGEHRSQREQVLVLRRERQGRKSVVALCARQRSQVDANHFFLDAAILCRLQRLGPKADDVEPLRRDPRAKGQALHRQHRHSAGVHVELQPVLCQLSFFDELLGLKICELYTLGSHGLRGEDLLAIPQAEDHAVIAHHNFLNFLAIFLMSIACIGHQLVHEGLEAILRFKRAAGHDPIHEFLVLDDAIAVRVYDPHDFVEVPLGKVGVQPLHDTLQFLHLDSAAVVAVPRLEGILHAIAGRPPGGHKKPAEEVVA